MSKSIENKLTPNFRFSEFKNDGNWQCLTLGEIGEPLMCRRIFKEETTPNPSNGIPFYKIGTFGRLADSYISKEIYEDYKSKYSFPKAGDILISASGTIGRLVIYDGSPAYFQDSNIIWLGHNENVILNSFLFFSYTNLKWQTSDGGVISRLYNSDFNRMKICFPQNQKEQQKIAACLSSLDEVIKAESQKLEVLKEHKKGLLQNLFPQGGEPIPVFRFKEFEGKWKNVLIGSLIEIKGRIGYRGYTTNDIVEKGKGAITFSPSNIDGNNQLNFEKATYISWDKYYESPEIMLQDGFTVLVKTGSSYGKAVFIKDLPEKTTINPQLVVLKPKNINPKFLFLLVCNSAIQNQIKETVVGGAIPTLSQESISMFEILIPPDKDKKEQEKISETLSSIDELIIAQIQKIEALNLHKKGLLQGLFPTISNEE